MRLQNLYLWAKDADTHHDSDWIPIEDYADSSLKRLIWVPETNRDIIYLKEARMKNVWQPKAPSAFDRAFWADREFIDPRGHGAWYRPRLWQFKSDPKRSGDRRHPHSNDFYRWLWDYRNRRAK